LFRGVGDTTLLTIASTGAATFTSSLTSDTLLVNAAAQANVTALIQGKVATAGTALKVISDGNGTDKVFEFTGADGVAAQTMTMLQSGNVGIGTTSPRAKLDVSDGTVNTSGEAIFQGLFTGPTRPSTSDLTSILTIQSNDAMAADKGGSIAFGGRAVSSSSAGANWAGISGLKENGTSANYNGYLQFWTRGGSSTEKMRITSGGDVCFGKTVYDNSTTGVSIADTKTTAIVSVVTDAGVSILCNRKTSTGDIILFRYNGSGVGSISTNGSTTSYNITSDYRLKEDLKETNGLQKVCAIKVYDFKWKNSENRMDGVLAHELEQIFPYAVNGNKDAIDEDGKIAAQGVDYSKLVPILIKSIQEQQTMITSLQEQINELKNK
jgi:hypothetical protein